MQSRRSAPSILFTALAATVVIVPWAISGSDSGEHQTASDAAPQLTQQPLDNLTVGESIREVHQDTPFSMVALTSPDLRGTSARVRARKDDGSWGPWYQAENLDGVGADTPGPRGTEPVFVGRTNTVQIAVTRAPQAPPPPPGKKGNAGPALGYVPANVEAPIGQNVTAVLISPPQAPVDVGPLPTAAINPGQPPTSRTTSSSTSTARCSRAAQAAWTSPSRDPTPAGSTSTPGVWR